MTSAMSVVYDSSNSRRSDTWLDFFTELGQDDFDDLVDVAETGVRPYLFEPPAKQSL